MTAKESFVLLNTEADSTHFASNPQMVILHVTYLVKLYDKKQGNTDLTLILIDPFKVTGNSDVETIVHSSVMKMYTKT